MIKPLKRYSPPNGNYLTTRDWIKKNHLGHTHYYQPFRKKELLVRLTKPKGLDRQVHWKFESMYQLKPPPTFVALIPNGRVYGENGSIITTDNKLIWDLSFEYEKEPNEHSIFEENSLSPYQKINGTIAVATFCASQYYYHWMFDVLPKLYLLKRRKIKIDKIVINGNYQHPFIEQTLAALNIPRSKLMNTSSTFHLKAEKLIVPSSSGYTGYMPKWTVHFLRKSLLNKNIVKIPDYERIYISREDGRGRKVINEEQVTNLLVPYGFKTLVLDQLSLDEQIQIFYSAKIIIAPHGGGLTNLVFANPGTRILEIFSPKYVNPLYWILSNYVKLDYYYLLGDDEKLDDHIDPGAVVADISINIEKLSKMMKLMNIN